MSTDLTTETTTRNLDDLVAVYKQFFYDEISRAEAMSTIGESQWDRVSRAAAFDLSNEGTQPVTDNELAGKYGSD